MSSVLKVNEIFYSLQGEGLHQGLPCVFVRLTGCPLRCTYCDTIYAYNEGTDMELPDVLQAVSKYPCDLVELTGGEPLAQPNSIPLMKGLISQGKTVLLETSGSMKVDEVPAEVIKIIDIKCPGSGMVKKIDLSFLSHMGPNDQIKFVISDKADFDWAVRLIQRKNLTQFPLYISPVQPGVNLENLAEWIIKTALPLRFHLQLHKIIWGDKPGV